MFLGYVFACLLMAVIAYYEKRILGAQDAKIMNYNSPLCIIASSSLLLFFSELKVDAIMVSKVAPYVLGIYLVNDHPIVRGNVWSKVLHCQNYYDSPNMIFHYLGCLAIFVILGIFADFVVSKFIEFASNQKLRL